MGPKMVEQFLQYLASIIIQIGYTGLPLIMKIFNVILQQMAGGFFAISYCTSTIWNPRRKHGRYHFFFSY